MEATISRAPRHLVRFVLAVREFEVQTHRSRRVPRTSTHAAPFSLIIAIRLVVSFIVCTRLDNIARVTDECELTRVGIRLEFEREYTVGWNDRLRAVEACTRAHESVITAVDVWVVIPNTDYDRSRGRTPIGARLRARREHSSRHARS